MIDASTSRRAVRPFLRGALVALLLAGSGLARGEPPEPLARYIPAEGLAALVEHNGLAAHPEAWKATAAYKMLNETALGAMLEDIMVQLADLAFQTAPAPRSRVKSSSRCSRTWRKRGLPSATCTILNRPSRKLWSW